MNTKKNTTAAAELESWSAKVLDAVQTIEGAGRVLNDLAAEMPAGTGGARLHVLRELLVRLQVLPMDARPCSDRAARLVNRLTQTAEATAGVFERLLLNVEADVSRLLAAGVVDPDGQVVFTAGLADTCVYIERGWQGRQVTFACLPLHRVPSEHALHQHINAEDCPLTPIGPLVILGPAITGTDGRDYARPWYPLALVRALSHQRRDEIAAKEEEIKWRREVQEKQRDENRKKSADYQLAEARERIERLEQTLAARVPATAAEPSSAD